MPGVVRVLGEEFDVDGIPGATGVRRYATRRRTSKRRGRPTNRPYDSYAHPVFADGDFAYRIDLRRSARHALGGQGRGDRAEPLRPRPRPADSELAPQADRVQVVLDDLACAPFEVVDVVVLGVEVAAGERIEPS